MNHNIPLAIPAAGMGKRVLPFTENLPKAMIPFNKRPLIDYVFDIAEQMEMKEVFVIVGHKAKIIKKHLGKQYRGMEINYVAQDQLRGLVHAISKLESNINKEFVMLLGDEVYFNTKHNKLIPFFRTANPDGGICGFMKTNDPGYIKKNYSIEIGTGNKIVRLVEKPDIVVNNYMGSGTTIFKPNVFKYIERTPVNPKRNEKEMADLIQTMIDDGKVFLPFDLKGSYINVNFPDDFQLVRRLLNESSKRNSN